MVRSDQRIEEHHLSIARVRLAEGLAAAAISSASRVVDEECNGPASAGRTIVGRRGGGLKKQRRRGYEETSPGGR